MREASSDEEFDGIEEDEEHEDDPSIRVLSNQSSMYNTIDLATLRLYPQRDVPSIRKMKLDFHVSSQSNKK